MTDIIYVTATDPESVVIDVDLIDPDPVVIEVAVIEATGPPGPAGEQGPPGPAGGAAIAKEASVAISGHRAVAFTSDGKVEYADNGMYSHLHQFVGITLNAAVEGDSVNVQSFGEIIEPSWSWSPGLPVFIGANGLLTQTPPSAPAFLRVVGVAMTSTSLWVRPEPGITQI